MSEQIKSQPDRRAILLGAGLIGSVGVAGAGLWLARRRGLLGRLFNPFSADHFDLPALAGLTDSAGAPIPGFSSADIAGKAVYLNAFASWCPRLTTLGEARAPGPAGLRARPVALGEHD